MPRVATTNRTHAMDALIIRRVTLDMKVNAPTKRCGVHIPEIEENTITTTHLTNAAFAEGQ